MKLDWQLIAVGIILVLAAIRIVAGIVRAVRRPSCPSCSCGCSRCPHNKKKKKKQ